MAFRHAGIVVAALVQSACAAPSLPRFEAALAANDSATAALKNWCEARGIAHPARITAAPVKDERIAPPPSEAPQFNGYRHVRLSCGGVVLSEAHNWYDRTLLTPEMNRQLDTTDRPFGTVVAPLAFRRKRLATLRGSAPGCPRETVLSHRARLILPDGGILALVVECYTPANLTR